MCFDTHLLSGHCRASTVSIIDTQGLGGVSRRPRDAPTGTHYEPFISPGPSGPSSGASADAQEGLAHDARLAGGVRGAGNAVNTVFFLRVARKTVQKLLVMAAVYARSAKPRRKHVFLEKTLVSSCFWACFATFGPHPQATDANDAVASARVHVRRRGLCVGFRLSLPVLSSLLLPVHCFVLILFLFIPCLLLFVPSFCSSSFPSSSSYCYSFSLSSCYYSFFSFVLLLFLLLFLLFF